MSIKIEKLEPSDLSAISSPLPMSDVDHLVLAEVQKIREGFISDIIMKCEGKATNPICIKMCDIDCPPVGSKCPKESGTALFLFRTFQKQLQIQSDDVIHLSVLKTIIHIELKMARLRALGSDGSFEEDKVVGVDQSGAAIMSKEINNAEKLMDRLLKRRDIEWKKLHALRGDTSPKINKVIHSYTNAIKNALDEGQPAIDAEFTEE